jgi:hypothetical protein
MNGNMLLNRVKKQIKLLQLEQEYEDITDEEYHNLIKRYVKNMNNAKQDLIDIAKRLED